MKARTSGFSDHPFNIIKSSWLSAERRKEKERKKVAWSVWRRQEL